MRNRPVIFDHTGQPFHHDAGETPAPRYFGEQRNSLRRFEAATTDRLNESQWETATGATVNEDIREGLSSLRRRCLHEVENNGFVEGVINTHVIDVVGPDGPTLQVESDDDKYNADLERAWNNWSEVAMRDGSSLPDGLALDVRLLWWAGEFLDQIVEVEEAQAVDGVTMRLHEVHPRRLGDPMQPWGGNIINGVEVDSLGLPMAYHVDSFIYEQGLAFGAPTSSERILPPNMIHFFKKVEPGQLRGYPWLAPVLQPVRDIRDYDAETLDAARAAANFGVMLATDHDDATFLETNECTDMERRTVRTCPPGWRPFLIDPKQPATSYVEFRTERHREIGRPVNMPAMLVRLDSSNHNYSSARFDGQRYDRGNRVLQAQLTRRKLMRCLRIVERQAGLARRRPANVKINFVWPVSPHVDPTKEAKAWETLLKIGIADEFTAAAALGSNYETICELRKRAAKCRADHGLEESAGNSNENGDDDERIDDKTRSVIRRLVEEAVEEMLDDDNRLRVVSQAL